MIKMLGIDGSATITTQEYAALVEMAVRVQQLEKFLQGAIEDGLEWRDGDAALIEIKKIDAALELGLVYPKKKGS
jgi:hypothetical protein